MFFARGGRANLAGSFSCRNARATILARQGERIVVTA